MADEITVKGFIIAKTMELAREELDAAAFATLEQAVGATYKSLKSAFFTDYPVALQMKVEEKVCEAVWGEPYATAVYRIGRLNFTSFKDSAIGRTALAFLGKDPRKIVLATVKLVSKVVSGLIIDVEERDRHEFALRFRNSPHIPLGWKGTVDAALEHAGVTPDVRILTHGHHDFEIVVGWS